MLHICWQKKKEIEFFFSYFFVLMLHYCGSYWHYFLSQFSFNVTVQRLVQWEARVADTEWELRDRARKRKDNTKKMTIFNTRRSSNQFIFLLLYIYWWLYRRHRLFRSISSLTFGWSAKTSHPLLKLHKTQ